MGLVLAMLLAAGPPEVAWLCGASDDGDFAELRFQRVGDLTLAPAVSRFTIVPRSTVTGVLLPGARTVLAVAYTRPARDETWAFSLLRLEPGRAPVMLLSNLAAASRPVVTRTGRVFVERGSAGPDAEAWRVDELRIDEVNPSTGVTRALLSARGFWASPVGTLGQELFVYRADPRGARLEALDLESGEARVLRASMPATAHDFTVDAVSGALLYTLGDPRTHGWRLERLELKSLQVTVLASGPSVALLPTVFPSGRVGFAPRAGGGLREAAPESQRVLLPPQGAGFERVRFFADGLALGLHEVPGDFPQPLAVSLADGAPVVLLAPKQMRLELVGVVP